MGYETTLIIGKVYPSIVLPSDNGKIYVGSLASIDLSGSDFCGTQIDQTDTQEAFFYTNSRTNEEKVEKDCYGAKLYAIDPQKVLNSLKEFQAKSYYRRYAAAIPLLESLIKDFDPEIEPLKCILFGH